MKQDSGKKSLSNGFQAPVILKAMRRVINRIVRLVGNQTWVLALAVAVVLAILITPRIGTSIGNWKVGMYANHAIKADRDFDLEDTASTQTRQREAAVGIYPIYDHDTKAGKRVATRLHKNFEDMRLFFGVPVDGKPEGASDGQVGKASLISAQAIKEQEERFQSELGVKLDGKLLAVLEQENYSLNVESATADLINYALIRMVVNDRQVMLDQVASLPGEKAITLRELNTRKERVYDKLDSIPDLATVLKQIETRAKEQIANGQIRAVALNIASQLIQPTLDFNRAATEERKDEARNKVGPSIIHFRKNQLIVAEGEQITAEHMVILRAMLAGAGTLHTLMAFIAAIALLFLAQMSLARFARVNIRKFNPSVRDFSFLSMSLVMVSLLAWLAKVVSAPLAASFSWLTPESFLFIMPIAGAAMAVRIILQSESALVLICLAAPVAGLMADNSLGYALYVLIGSLVGAHSISHAQRRGVVMRGGVSVGLVNMAVAFAIQVISDPSSITSFDTPVNVAAAFIGGLLTGPFALASIHPIEVMFGYTSNLQLMELANLSHPLLERMMLEAPGTYHHSLFVSALAEKGAEGIKANPLLTKVAGLYHDIGKINKPRYFIENQHGLNPHDNLPPRMSSLILINHVREGVEYAKRYNLGERIEAIIAEHHGTSRIRYFFNLAKQQEEAEREKVNETDFRYKGPKPQSREAALVMMADVVEAATRSLKAPTPARIETTVKELINAIHADGQLDDCDLTMRDLNRIAGQYITILHGRYHGRIEYPEEEQSKRGNVVNLNPVEPNPNEIND